jgi:hypothetical protein
MFRASALFTAAKQTLAKTTAKNIPNGILAFLPAAANRCEQRGIANEQNFTRIY